MNEVTRSTKYGDIPFHSISYDAGSDCGPISGMSLTGGYTTEINGTRVVKFEQKFKGQQIAIKYDTRPDLAALVDEYEALKASESAAHQAVLDAQKAEQDAIDAPLLAEMRAKVDALVASIPADHVRVTVTQTGDLDGSQILTYEADGVTLQWDQVENIGNVCAVRPGALGAFAEEYVRSISRTKLAEIKAAQTAKEQQYSDNKSAHEKDLAETPIPPSALDAYRRYHGDAEAAWTAEDESAWALINAWSRHIEVQHGMDNLKLNNALNEATNEANYGISD